MLEEVEMSECLRCNIKEKNSKMKGMFAFTAVSSPPLTRCHTPEGHSLHQVVKGN